jgi:hypothetical protein
MGTRETYQKTLVQACAVAGDEGVLAKKLRIPVSVLVDYLLGERAVPADVFLKAADVVLGSTRKRNAESRALLEQIKRRHRR